MTPERKQEFLSLPAPDNDPDDLTDFECTGNGPGEPDCDKPAVLTWGIHNEGFGHALCTEHAHQVFGDVLPRLN